MTFFVSDSCIISIKSRALEFSHIKAPDRKFDLAPKKVKINLRSFLKILVELV